MKTKEISKEQAEAALANRGGAIVIPNGDDKSVPFYERSVSGKLDTGVPAEIYMSGGKYFARVYGR